MGSGGSSLLGRVRRAVEPSPWSDHGLAPSSFRASIRTWYAVSARSPVIVVLVSDPSRRHSVQSPPSASRYAMSYEVSGGLPVMSGAVQVTSSSDVGELADWATDGASGRGGASFTSVTRIVTVTVTAAPLTLTVSEYDCVDSWSSTAPAATRIWPVAASIVNAPEPDSE